MKNILAALLCVISLTSHGSPSGSGRLTLAEGGRAHADIMVEARQTYDLTCSVQDLADILNRMTGAKFQIVKSAARGRPLIRIANDPSLAEQETLVRVTGSGVDLLGSDHPEYAIYDFLRDFCGCRWLDPTEAGDVIPSKPTLAVRIGEMRDLPYCLARRNSGVFTTYNPLLWREGTPGWTNYVMTAYPAAFAKGGFGAAVKEMNFFRTRFKRRMKAQGRPSVANHSFYWFIDRFLNPTDRNFIEFHPEFFAKGYERKEDANKSPEDIYSEWDPRKAPPQMCYSNEGLFRQTLVDIRAYFDNGGYTNRYRNVGTTGYTWGADTYCLEPHDNGAFCRCDECTRQYRPERKAERGTYSDYWFRFVNRVAREISKSHPGKKISTLAYGSGREAMPSFPIEPNVVVHFCYSCNRMPNSATKAVQERLLREWHKAYPCNTFGVWLYNCFPQERTVRPGGFNCFPGFFGSMLAGQYRFLKEVNAKEIIFNCGMTDDFESFLTFRLMWNPDEDYAALKDEWFGSFGAAEKPIRAFYDLVERRFCDPANYPPDTGHQTPLLAWGYLGTADVMDKLADLMAEAEAAADTPQAKARTANWRAGVWNYMLEGKQQSKDFDSGRPGVTANRTIYLGRKPPAFNGNVLRGKHASATCAGIWHGIFNHGKATEKLPLSDLPVLTDGNFSTAVWMNGHPTTDLVVKVACPVKNLSRLRLTISFNSFLRSRGIIVPLGFKDGRAVELAGELRQDVQPYPNWKVARDDMRRYCTLEWAFAPGSAPRDLDGVGYADRGIREKWLSPCVAEIEARDGADDAAVALARDGSPRAQIVLASKPTRAAKFAAYELKWHLDAITGADFKIVPEDQAAMSGLIPIFVGGCSRSAAKPQDFEKQNFLVDVRPDAIELVGRDKEDFGNVSYRNDENGVAGSGWPNMFDDQGTVYAVYDFLEFVVGVKWLDATDVGTLLPSDPGLAVSPCQRRGKPFVRYRAHSGRPNIYNPVLWKNSEPGYAAYMDAAFKAKGAKERALQGELFQIRHRMGGECLPANHSFYDFYAKYWNKRSRGFVEFRPDYFAKGYTDGTEPPQLCYSNPATVERVIAYIREYFDNPKGPKRWGVDNYCLEPMDNCSFCKCDRCSREYEPERSADNASQSTHWFRFVNKVARAIKSSHPDKHLSTLAYFQHEGLPTGFRLEDNVTVYFCLSGNRTPFRPLLENQLNRMREWRAAYPNQPLAMWLYNCFPSENARNGNFHCFPGFFSAEEERQYGIFRELDISAGIFHCGFDGEVDNYIQLEKMIDPSRPVETLKDEFFSMYGKAAKPLREFYDTVERRYCDKNLYPKGSGHQSAPVAWGILGTKEVMDKLAALMAEAERLADTDIERRRVAIWRLSVWEYMKEGRESFVRRMSAPQPSWKAARVKPAGGDPNAVDWGRASSTPMRFFAAGADELSGYTGGLRLAHDGSWLYLELKITVPDTKTLVNLPTICSHDCWEILMARQKGQPYRCWFVAPDGRSSAASWGEVNFRSGVSSEESGQPGYGVSSVTDLSNGKDWVTRLACPLDRFLDAPVKPGDSIFLNAVNIMGNEHPEVQEWVKTHGGRFIMSTLTSHTTVHTTDRIATVTLEK